MIERPDYIQPKNGEIEELGCLDQLPVDVLETGKQHMSYQKVIICGIAQDNVNELSIMMKYMELTGQLFLDYRIIIFENDSIDGTKDLLSNWSSTNDKVKIITHDYHNMKRPAISFLAEARNYYLYEISNHTILYNDYDIMMIVDMDMKYGWDMRGIYHSFYHINDWDMICSNGVGHHSGSMYDRFAFQLLNIGNQTRWHTRFYEPDSGLVPVKSCFGGLAFYKLSSIYECYYDITSEGCEHKSFHNCMKSQHDGRLYLNPTQIIRYSHYS